MRRGSRPRPSGHHIAQVITLRSTTFGSAERDDGVRHLFGERDLPPTDFSTSFATALRRKRFLPGTIKNYTGYMERFRLFCLERNRTLRQSTIDDCLDFVETLPRTRASREQFQNAYRAWWRHVSGRSGPCPAESIRLPGRTKRPFNGLEREQVYALLREAKRMGPREYACCCLLYYALCRNEEARSLKRDAIKDGWVHIIGKGLKPRLTPVHRTLFLAISELEESRTDDSEWMFAGKYPDTHISGNTVNVWVRLAAAAAGLGHVTPHQLRKSSGAACNDDFGDLRATGELLGHSKNSIAVTAEVYTRTRDSKLRLIVDSL